MRVGVAIGHGVGPIDDDTPEYSFDDITNRDLIGEEVPKVGTGPNFHKELLVNAITRIQENRCVRVFNSHGGEVEEDPCPI